MSSIVVQTAVDDIGKKATTELQFEYNSLVNCGKYQYGFNENGIFLLNQGNTDNSDVFESSFTMQTSDFGAKNNKRFRYIYLEVEVYEHSTFTVTVTPNNGTAISKSVSTIGPGIKTISFTIQKSGGQGNYHKVKIASNEQFRIHSVSGLMIVNSLGFRRNQ